MKFISLSALLLFSSILFTNLAIAQEQKLHTLSFKSAEKLHLFFKYKKENKPIISGHRGGMVKGFPENSIATLENTLKFTHAFFEIDPRLTKDSVIVLMHDATLDRTTTGKGKLSNYTWDELKELKLKDTEGNITEFGIPTLAEALEWAKGKTILNLDIKDVPFEMTADIIEKYKANSYVMLTVHSPEQAQFYLDRDSTATFSAHIKTPEVFESYKKAGIPWAQMIAYIGSQNIPENQVMYKLLHNVGVKVMISTAPSYDKLPSKEDRAKAYRDFMDQGPDIIESDLPIEVSKALTQKI